MKNISLISTNSFLKGSPYTGVFIRARFSSKFHVITYDITIQMMLLFGSMRNLMRRKIQLSILGRYSAVNDINCTRNLYFLKIAFVAINTKKKKMPSLETSQTSFSTKFKRFKIAEINFSSLHASRMLYSFSFIGVYFL